MLRETTVTSEPCHTGCHRDAGPGVTQYSMCVLLLQDQLQSMYSGFKMFLQEFPCSWARFVGSCTFKTRGSWESHRAMAVGRGIGRAGSRGAALLVTSVLQLVLTPAAAFTCAPSVAQLGLRNKHGEACVTWRRRSPCGRAPADKDACAFRNAGAARTCSPVATLATGRC